MFSSAITLYLKSSVQDKHQNLFPFHKLRPCHSTRTRLQHPLLWAGFGEEISAWMNFFSRCFTWCFLWACFKLWEGWMPNRRAMQALERAQSLFPFLSRFYELPVWKCHRQNRGTFLRDITLISTTRTKSKSITCFCPRFVKMILTICYVNVARYI